jgi:hypothetical protein
VAYRIDDSPDTLPYSTQVHQWMARHWKHGPCPVCGTDSWRAEGRLFGVPRLQPAPSPDLIRGVFPVVCEGCAYTVWIGAQEAGLFESPIPDDLTGLG